MAYEIHQILVPNQFSVWRVMSVNKMNHIMFAHKPIESQILVFVS